MTSGPYSAKNLEGENFKGRKLAGENFTGANLKSANFKGADLSGAVFVDVQTGIKTSSKALLFTLTLLLASFASYFAALAGSAVQVLLRSGDQMQIYGAYLTVVFAAIFTGISIWKGLFFAINKILVGMIALALLLGAFMYLSGFGTGRSAIYGSLGLISMVLMFVVSTIARATVGTLGSNVLFFAVAIGSALYAKTLGGGIGATIMAVSCAIISKRALKTQQNSVLKKIAVTCSSYFGTSFENANLHQADFSNSTLNNCSLRGANTEKVNWSNTKKNFCLE